MSGITMNNHFVVHEWLQGIFADEPVPVYYKSDAFIQHLHAMMAQDILRTKDTEVYKKFSEVAVEDYSKDVKFITKILSKLGLKECVDVVSAETNVLSTTADLLSLSTIDENSYVLSIMNLIMDKEQTTADISSMDSFIQQCTKELSSALELTSQLESVLNTLQKEADASKSGKGKTKETKFLRNKAAKYKAEQKEHDLKLSKAGASRDLTHGQLVTDYAELQQLKTKLLETEDELSKFAALPPDRELAKVKLEVARGELRDLENELVGQIDLCHL
ncbi:HAUS augmin-like complex subunit 1 [Watersipora subatra]|uniref:HAUS augmin-like complex subunit 1 n=1 Tax=Watersipora subatra TaxID=2589382 RepID=UPI00355BEC71